MRRRPGSIARGAMNWKQKILTLAALTMFALLGLAVVFAELLELREEPEA
jgi:hypothetical protein